MQDDKTISTTDVRQGSKRKDNLRVLVMSAFLVATVSLILYVGYDGFARLWR